MSPEEDNPEATADRIARKEAEFSRAEEIVAPSGFINTDDVSINEARGEKVVLLDFWTYTCFNCQNTQPYINRWHQKYADDGLRIVGVHTPEFGFEREYANVEQAVREAGIRYPVVLDNSYATWDAYDQRYWPAWYLIDADGFIRYKHFGEGAYGETEAKIQELLAEKDRIQN
ncbi:MAG: redoxin domain-containing protein [Rubrobacter sp.]|nr:redoxin domain-containing protein [Rubrobacter sp.]